MPKRFDQTTNATAVAAADQIPFITAAGVTSYVTGDEFAASTPLSSRYKPLASDSIWVGANQFFATNGSPVAGNFVSGLASNAFLFDSAANEIVGFTLLCPPGWSTFKIDLYWTNDGAGSGDVYWYVQGQFRGDGETVNTTLFTGEGAITAPAENVLKVTQLLASETNQSNEVLIGMLGRAGQLAQDTLGNDAAVLGLKFTRLT